MKDLKKCFTCNETKLTTQFYWRNKSKSVRLGRCVECMRLYHRSHYRDSDKRKLNTKRQLIKARQRNTIYVNDYLREHPCVDCGFSDIRALDFDHIRDKEIDISALRFKGAAIARLQAEMDKCEVRCAICHRIVTAERRNHTILDVDVSAIRLDPARPLTLLAGSRVTDASP